MLPILTMTIYLWLKLNFLSFFLTSNLLNKIQIQRFVSILGIIAVYKVEYLAMTINKCLTLIANTLHRLFLLILALFDMIARINSLNVRNRGTFSCTCSVAASTRHRVRSQVAASSSQTHMP